MKKFFVTGTDTDVGKTIASTILTLALEGCYWKPIQSGPPDLEAVQQYAGLDYSHFFPSIYSLKASLSPDQAAKLENITIDLANIDSPITTKNLIVEGAGGVYAPVNQNQCMLDLMQKLQLPIIIVARGKLGTINHSLLTIETLRLRGLKIHGIIFNGEVYPDSQATIEKWGKVRTLFHIPTFNEITPAVLQQWVGEHKQKIMENLLCD